MLERHADVVAMNAGRIFLSHSRLDRSSAARLVSGLRTAGMPTWISGPELHCPAWRDAIFPHIADCAAFIVLVSPHAAMADGVRQEINYAKQLRKPIIPLPASMFTSYQVAQSSQCQTDEPRYVDDDKLVRLAHFLYTMRV
jgi:hypothetical protein